MSNNFIQFIHKLFAKKGVSDTYRFDSIWKIIQSGPLKSYSGNWKFRVLNAQRGIDEKGEYKKFSFSANDGSKWFECGTITHYLKSKNTYFETPAKGSFNKILIDNMNGAVDKSDFSLFKIEDGRYHQTR